nr:hypothetical protein CFP56_78946 [Quercus suber]
MQNDGEYSVNPLELSEIRVDDTNIRRLPRQRWKQYVTSAVNAEAVCVDEGYECSLMRIWTLVHDAREPCRRF